MKLSRETADMPPLPRDQHVLLMQPMDRTEGNLAVHVSLAPDVSQDMEDVDESFDHRHTTSLRLTGCGAIRSSWLFIITPFYVLRASCGSDSSGSGDAEELPNVVTRKGSEATREWPADAGHASAPAEL
jgi:hypothetical protein